MHELSRLFGFLLVYSSLLSSSVSADDICVQKSSCICVFSNGTGLDLTPTLSSPFYTVQTFREEKTAVGKLLKLITYYYHPCSDIALSLNVSGNNTCTKNLALSRHTIVLEQSSNTTGYALKPDTCEFLGSANTSKFSGDSRSIQFFNPPSDSRVLNLCSQSDDHLSLYSSDDPNDLILAFYSREACLKQVEEPGRSVGSTLLIVFFSLAIFYLVLGICTKKFLMGATGIEVIPNLAFWTELPNLVRDGWAFAINGFKLPARSGPMSSPDPNSYDSI